MRMHLRPEYLFRRACHRVSVTLWIWRRNRAAAEAFRNPLIDGGIAVYLPSFSRNPSLKMLAVAVAASALSLWLMMNQQRKASQQISLSVPATPSPAVPAPMLSGPPGPPSPSAPPVLPKASAPEPSPLPALIVPPAEARLQSVRLPEQGNALIACKRDRTLYVYKRDGKHWEKVAAFPMAFGRKSGDKQASGDLRTPEGRYWIIGMFPGPSKGAMYGSLVFTLNYPDPADEADGKTGQGIWIHGVEAGKLPTFTHGCMSLSNGDLLGLADFADIGTPVLILPDSASPDPARQMDLVGMEREYPAIMVAHGRRTHSDSTDKDKTMQAARDFVAKEAKDFPELDMQTPSEEDRKAILARLESWREDWSSRKVEAYAGNYDADFRDGEGRDKVAFLERKRKIFASKSRIDMEIGEPKIESEGYARVKVSFRQDYLAESPEGVQRSSGSKTLRLEQGPAGWLIIGE